MSSFYQKYCLWVTSNFSHGRCQNRTLPNLKYSQVGLELFWKNRAETEQSGVASNCRDAFSRVCIGLLFSTLYTNLILKNSIISQSVLG